MPDVDDIKTLMGEVIEAYNIGARHQNPTGAHKHAVSGRVWHATGPRRGVIVGTQNGESPDGRPEINDQLGRDWQHWDQDDDPFKPLAAGQPYAPQVVVEGDRALATLELLYAGQAHVGTAVLRKRGHTWKISAAHLEPK